MLLSAKSWRTVGAVIRSAGVRALERNWHRWRYRLGLPDGRFGGAPARQRYVAHGSHTVVIDLIAIRSWGHTRYTGCPWSYDRSPVKSTVHQQWCRSKDWRR
jgi:hypothetical protein